MTWNRQTSELEPLMVEVLKRKRKPLSLSEVVNEIAKVAPEKFTGSTPRNSLYSVIYRREKRRIAQSQEVQFLQENCRGEVLFSINPKFKK